MKKQHFRQFAWFLYKKFTALSMTRKFKSSSILVTIKIMETVLEIKWCVFDMNFQMAGQDPKWQKDAADQNFDYMFKLLIIGNSSVGKTSFLFRYADDSFTSAFVSTVGIDFKVKTVFRHDKRVKLQIWVSKIIPRFAMPLCTSIVCRITTRYAFLFTSSHCEPAPYKCARFSRFLLSEIRVSWDLRGTCKPVKRLRALDNYSNLYRRLYHSGILRKPVESDVRYDFGYNSKLHVHELDSLGSPLNILYTCQWVIKCRADSTRWGSIDPNRFAHRVILF